eukprot:COSAG04_NODE_2381_length_4233_cov_38.831640_7_plen_225_part_00
MLLLLLLMPTAVAINTNLVVWPTYVPPSSGSGPSGSCDQSERIADDEDADHHDSCALIARCMLIFGGYDVVKQEVPLWQWENGYHNNGTGAWQWVIGEDGLHYLDIVGWRPTHGLAGGLPALTFTSGHRSSHLGPGHANESQGLLPSHPALGDGRLHHLHHLLDWVWLHGLRGLVSLCWVVGPPGLPQGKTVAYFTELDVTPKPLRRNYQLAWGMGRYGYCTSY